VALAFTAASSKTDQTAISETVAVHGAKGFASAWLRRKDVAWATTLLTTTEETSDVG
jgi:type IV secretion system protein VirB4